MKYTCKNYKRLIVPLHRDRRKWQGGTAQDRKSRTATTGATQTRSITTGEDETQVVNIIYTTTALEHERIREGE